jgi:hypothetical protein
MRWKPESSIKFIVPLQIGGTNDQARRVAACIENVEVDLPVDGDNDMVQSIDTVLDKMARKMLSLYYRRNSNQP